LFGKNVSKFPEEFERGKAINMVSCLEINAVIDQVNTRNSIKHELESTLLYQPQDADHSFFYHWKKGKPAPIVAGCFPLQDDPTVLAARSARNLRAWTERLLPITIRYCPALR
jgi:hypothetical protein